MEGRYQAYLEYKDSSYRWLGKMPWRWRLFYGKRVFSNRREVARTNDEQLAASQKYGVVPQTLMMDLYESKVMLALKGTSSFRHVEKGDFVISLRSFEGGIEYSDYVGCVSPAYTVLKPDGRISADFYRYFFKSKPYITALQSTTDSLRDGKSITYQQFGSIPLVLPSLQEQHQIANFLDHETAKIDTLIEKQQKLISLLGEKRQAVISHAVTKGLNPDAPMKDSGVEWLGEVPAHWGVSRVKFHSLVKGRIGFRGYTVEDLVDENEGALVIGATEMTFSGSIELSSPQYISWEKYYESPEIMLEAGMILIVQRGSTVGKVAYVEDGLGKATINPSLIVLKNMEIEPRYLSFSLMESRIQNVVRMQTSSTAIPMISQEQVGNYYILIPLKEEQVDICAYIDNNAKAVETAINASNRSIKLLQERRTALISAAVTGKIDVRNWQSPTDKDIQ